ncbi:MAG: rod-binding protein [Planctomycetaceae bacterium]|jgi:hypothetical protein|nr:rod-binding protein [Planctomycetaceae bacterium]
MNMIDSVKLLQPVSSVARRDLADVASNKLRGVANEFMSTADVVEIDSQKKQANTYQPPPKIVSVAQNKTLTDNKQTDNKQTDNNNTSKTILKDDEREFRELFHKFTGQVLFGEMLKRMRATQEKNPYFHGGRAEEIFQDELDNKLVEQLTKSTTKNLSEPMYNQFKRLQKKS